MHSTSLVIDSIKEKDSGSYKVMAINTEGSAESTASLLVSLREEQSANYLGFVRRSAKAHESIDSMAEQRKDRKFRVDLRCVGSPFDKMSKVHQGRSRSKTALVRTVYFKSASHPKEKESEKESKRLETASERALSPPPMFDRSERFNDRFSDIYCDRRTGARFSDKFSDRCSDRYSERFSDTESLHNEVRTKLTTLQKAVKQKKRLSISTMSSSEFELESAASESSYADYVDRLRLKPASLPDVQHFSRPFDLGDTHREFQGKTSSKGSSQPRVRHSFEPQSRRRAIQIMRGELVDTLVSERETKSGDKRSSTLGDKDIQSFVESQVSERHSVVADQKAEATDVESNPPEVPYSEGSPYPVTAAESMETPTLKSGTSVRERFLRESVLPEDKDTTQTPEPYEEECAGRSLRSQYESLEAERMECEEKLLALRIRKWQQGSRMSEEEMFHPETDLPSLAEAQYMEPTGDIYPQQEVVEKRGTEETETVPPSFHKSPRTKARALYSESATVSTHKSSREEKVRESASPEIRLEEEKDGSPLVLGEKSPRMKARAAAELSPRTKARSEDELRVKSIKERFLSEATTPETAQPYEEEAGGESLRAEYEKSLEAERMECEEKLLALRIRKWQQGVRMTEGEIFHPETDLPMVVDAQEHIYTQQEVVEKQSSADHPPVPTPKSPRVKARAELQETSAPSPKARMKGRPGGVEPESSPKTKDRAEKMLFEKTKEERELQLSRENISELKNESERFVSEEEALTQRIMKWQQDVMMEQVQEVKTESDWVQAASGAKETLQSFPQLEALHSTKSSPRKTAKDEFLLSDSPLAGFQNQEGDGLKWPPAGELLTEGRETRLQRDSEYFVSEEEALAQRILKWQQDAVEQEEVAELESEWALDSQYKPSGSGLPLESHVTPFVSGIAQGIPPSQLQHTGLSQHVDTPVELVQDEMGRQASPVTGGPSVRRRSPCHSPPQSLGAEAEMMPRDKSLSQRFQSELREERGMREEGGTARESSERRQQKGFASEMKPETLKQVGETTTGHLELGAIKKEERRVQEESETKKVKEGDPKPEGSRPVFVKVMSSVKVMIGEMSEFTCQFQGDPLPTVTWLKDGHPLDHNPDYDIISKSNISKLTVFYPTTHHEGTYDCVITNKHGKSICSATLELSDKKVFRSTGVAQEVVVTQDVEKDEENQESLIETELQTFMDSRKSTLQVPQVVIHKRRSSDETFSSSPVEIRITAATPVPEMIEEISEDTPQDFTEKMTDVSGDEGASQTVKHKFTFTFDVAGEAPCVVSELKNIRCPEGNTAVLECAITGEPAPEVTWFCDDVCLEIKSGKYRAEVEDKVYRLYINSFTHADAGVYRCVASNKLGEVTSVSDVSLQAAQPLQFSEGGDVVHEKSPVGVKKTATEDLNPPTKAKPQSSQAPSDVAIKAPRSRPGLSREPPTISGCGLQTSAALINVSQIKQAFESDSTLMTPPSPEQQKKEMQFPEEFIPAVAISPDQQQQIVESFVDTMQTECGDQLGTAATVASQSPEVCSGIFQTTKQREVDALKQFVEEVEESPELVRPKPQKPTSFPKHMEGVEMEMLQEETVPSFDRTSSFIPFQSERVPTQKRSGRTSAEEPVKPKRNLKAESAAARSIRSEAEVSSVTVPVGLDQSLVAEGLTEFGQDVRDETKRLDNVGGELISVPEPSVDSGVFVSMPDFQSDTTQVTEKSTVVDVTELTTQMKEPEPLVVKPKVDARVKALSVSTQGQEGDRRLNRTPGAEAHGSMEEEEVTFGAVFDYYNPPADWGRPLSPESEMSIEIGSTVSEEITEVAERFYTPESSTEVSQPIAESFRTPKSPISSQTPSSDTPAGFMTPQDYPFSPVEHKRSSTGDSSEFFSPLQFLTSPADDNIETFGLSVDENRFLAQSKGSLGLATLQEKVQGIPPAFLKPLIKKRVFENDSLTFYAEVFGLPSPEVKWFCNKTQLVADDRVTVERDGDSISLTIRNITKADQGEYICEAVNYVGEARSVALVVVVSQEVRFMPAPPAVTHQHVMEFDVEEDDSSRSPSPQEILLEVELDENEVKEFEKQVKIITIPEYTADNKSMIISLDVLPSIYEEGAVDFVTQEHDDLKIAFEVTEMPPRFINPICDMETPEGTTVMFECSLMGIPSPIVSWFKGDKKVPHNNKKYLHSSDGDNHFLKICKVTPQDSGVYTCRAINVVGETLCRASLVVLSAKAFSGKARGRELTAVSLGSAKVQPQKFDLMVGNTSLDGEQVSEIELEFEFEQEADESQRAVRLVANTDNETSEQGEKYVSINFDVFAEPAKDDKVEFKGKSSDTCSFQFQVTETPPKCVIPLTNVTAAVGTPVILQCLVNGKPTPSAEWFKDGDRVTDSRYIIQEKTSGHFNLLITNVNQADAGEYKCIIQNSAGCIETAALLKVF